MVHTLLKNYVLNVVLVRSILHPLVFLPKTLMVNIGGNSERKKDFLVLGGDYCASKGKYKLC